MFILILAALVGGGVYAWKAGLIPGSAPKQPSAAPGSLAPGSSSSDAQRAASGKSSPGVGAPKAPSSIFDDNAKGSTTTAPPPPRTANVERPAPVSPPPVPPAAPPAPDVAALELAARDAERAFTQVRDAAVSKLRSAPRFSTKQAEVDRLEADLKKARASGTAQQKLDASAAWNKARVALDAEYDAALKTDAAYAAAEAAAMRAREALRAARAAAKTSPPGR